MKFVQIKSKKRFQISAVVLILSVVLSGYRSVSAFALAVPVATAYPTLTPIGTITTPVSILDPMDFTCPVGLPAGAGVVTPSTDWLYACGQCLVTSTPVSTPEILSTSTPSWIGTGTPPANCTPFPYNVTGMPPTGCEYATQTPTPFPTPLPTTVPNVCGNLQTFGIWDAVPSDIDNASGIFASFTSSSVVCNSVSGVISCSGQIVVTDTSDGSDGGVQSGIKIINTNLGGTVAYTMTSRWTSSYYGLGVDNPVTYSYGGASIWNSDLPGVGYFGGTYTSGGLSSASGVMTVNSGYDFAWLKVYTPCHYYAGTVCHLDIDISISASSSCFIGTPTPTPLATPSSLYCASVSGEDVPNQFSLNGTGAVVSQSCAFTPEISFENILLFLLPNWYGFQDYFISIFPVSLVIPPFTICTRLHDYSLYIFGYRMPVEAILGLGILFSAFRFAVPSLFSGVTVIGQNTPSVSQTTSVSTSKSVGSTRITNTKTTRRKG